MYAQMRGMSGETPDGYRDVANGKPPTSCRVHIAGTWVTSVRLVSSHT